MPASKRLFFALWPDAELRARLAATAERLDAGDGRKVSPDNLHLTLLFLGAVPVERLDALKAAAGQLKAEAFDVWLDHGGWWRRPRIWGLFPAAAPPALAALAAGLAEAARRAGLAVRHEDYRPHVTLMRKVSSAPADPPFTPVEWKARDFHLLESVTHPEGPEYRVLERWPLRPPGGVYSGTRPHYSGRSPKSAGDT